MNLNFSREYNLFAKLHLLQFGQLVGNGNYIFCLFVFICNDSAAPRENQLHIHTG